MKLFRFPYLIQKEVLDNFTGHDIMILSMLSANLKNRISLIQKARFDNIQYVRYDVSNIRTDVIAVCNNKCNDKLVSIIPLSGTDRPLECTVSGMRAQFLMSNYPDQLVFVHNDPLPAWMCFMGLHQSQLIEAIHEHLCGLLGPRTGYHFHVNRNEKTSTDFVSLPRLKNIDLISIRGSTIDVKHLDYALSMPTSSYFVHLDVKIEGELMEGSPLLNARSLNINSENDEFCLKILSGFNGKSLEIRLDENGSAAFLNDWKISRFLNDWKLKKAGRNLQYFEVNSLWIWREIQVNVVGYKRLESVKPVLFVDEERKLSTRDYIVRESDGRLAAILVNPGIFYFKISDLTEKELLEQFEKKNG